MSFKPNFDKATLDDVSISHDHHEIHQGNHYVVASFDTVNSGASLAFGVTTPNTRKWTHLTYEVEGTSQTEFYVYEGATLSGGGAVTPFNNNRNSANTSDLTLTKNPTASGTGTSGTQLISSSKGLVGTTPSRADITAIQGRNKEIILKSGTTYLFEIRSLDDDNIIDYEAEWYEHTNKI